MQVSVRQIRQCSYLSGYSCYPFPARGNRGQKTPFLPKNSAVLWCIYTHLYPCLSAHLYTGSTATTTSARPGTARLTQVMHCLVKGLVIGTPSLDPNVSSRSFYPVNYTGGFGRRETSLTLGVRAESVRLSGRRSCHYGECDKLEVYQKMLSTDSMNDAFVQINLLL